MSKIIATILLALLLGFSGITYIALESGNVIEVETRDFEGQTPRVTNIWYVQSEDGILLEGGHPDNPWVRDLAQIKTIRIRGSGIDGEYRFKLITHQAAHEEIRERMREKYGWRDWWISCTFNVKNSLMIQILPA